MGLGNRLNGKWVWPGKEETLRVKNNTESASVLLTDTGNTDKTILESQINGGLNV